MNTQQRLKQIKGLVQQAQAMHKPVFIGADELQIFIESLDAVERERDEAILTRLEVSEGLSIATRRYEAAEAELARREAAAGEAVSFELKQHYSGIGKSGPWVKLNGQRTYEKLKLKHAGDADYEFRELFTAAQPAALPDDYFSSLVSKARQSAEKAMIKFPQPNYVLLKVAEEAGEVVQAGVHYAEGRETWENLEGEVVQTMAMLYRLVTEGDQVNGVIPPAAPAQGEMS